MRNKIILLLAIAFFFQNPSPAEAGVGSKVIGTTVKSVVKIVVATTNVEKVKKGLINKLNMMEDGEFRERYTKFYPIVKDLPPHLKTTYNVSPHMTRAQMIENIKSVDKKKIYKIINGIPDKTVTELFKTYLRETKRKPAKKV
ncbi:hypothetical protein ACFL28_04355 [Candidatus Omnitrophota bacterium]